MSRQCSRSRVLCISENISYRTSYLISISCCSSLASRSYVRAEPVKHVVELNRRHKAEIQYPHHRFPKEFFQTDSEIVAVPIWYQDKGMPGSLFQEVTLKNAACISLTTITQLEGSINFSFVAALYQAQTCSAHMMDGPPDLFSLRLQTAPATSSSPGTNSLTGNGPSTTGMLRSGGGGVSGIALLALSFSLQ